MINETILKEDTIQTLQEEFNFSKEKATTWFENNSEAIVDSMYDSIAKYIEREVTEDE